jgi:hypothetical protein
VNRGDLVSALTARAAAIAATNPDTASRMRACAARLAGQAPEVGDANHDATAIAVANHVAAFAGATGDVHGAARHNTRPGASPLGQLLGELGAR